MKPVDKATWLLLEDANRAVIVTELLKRTKSENLEDRREAKKQLLAIVGWLDESED